MLEYHRLHPRASARGCHRKKAPFAPRAHAAQRTRNKPNKAKHNKAHKRTSRYTPPVAVLACRRRRGTRGGVVWQDGSSPPPYLMRMRKYGYPPGYTGAPSLCFGADGRT